MRGNAALELGNHSRLVFSEGITRKSKAVRKLFLLIKFPNALSSLFGDVSFRVGLDDFLQGCLSSINAAKATLQKIIKTYPKTDVAKEAAQRIREFDQKK